MGLRARLSTIDTWLAGLDITIFGESKKARTLSDLASKDWSKDFGAMVEAQKIVASPLGWASVIHWGFVAALVFFGVCVREVSRASVIPGWCSASAQILLTGAFGLILAYAIFTRLHWLRCVSVVRSEFSKSKIPVNLDAIDAARAHYKDRVSRVRRWMTIPVFVLGSVGIVAALIGMFQAVPR